MAKRNYKYNNTVDLSNLIYKTKRNYIDWKASIGKTIPFTFNDGKLVGEFTIIDYKIPNDLEELVIIGSSVLVPFGKSGVLTEELICHIGINRKSPKYDKPYYELYSILNKIVFEKENLALELYLATKKLTNSKIGGAWRKYFFNSTARSVIKRNGLNVLHNVPILQAKTQEHFKEEFFKMVAQGRIVSNQIIMPKLKKMDNYNIDSPRKDN